MITAEQQATLARIAARQREFAALSIGDGHRLATRRTSRREHRQAMRDRKADRRALEMSTGPIWLVPGDPVPARTPRPIRPIPFPP
ncbi:hypothetical protein, partial [Corynebacterium variabile]|uniref:hypothetical protein n=1 Tax=Corynebacterium variabile TaxID=1727 RepID=UPI003F96B877